MNFCLSFFFFYTITNFMLQVMYLLVYTHPLLSRYNLIYRKNNLLSSEWLIFWQCILCYALLIYSVDNESRAKKLELWIFWVTFIGRFGISGYSPTFFLLFLFSNLLKYLDENTIWNRHVVLKKPYDFCSYFQFIKIINTFCWIIFGISKQPLDLSLHNTRNKIKSYKVIANIKSIRNREDRFNWSTKMFIILCAYKRTFTELKTVPHRPLYGTDKSI